MTASLALFLALTLTLAALMISWVLMFAIAVAHRPRREAALCVLPPVAPFVAWRAGRRRLPLGFAVLVVVYGALFLLAELAR
ncbi:MAG: hypothetical protein AB7S26_27445 [Sandaracinaceae bacterium]